MKPGSQLASIVVLLLSLIACGPGSPANVEGMYTLARDEFKDMATKAVSGLDQIPDDLAKQLQQSSSMMLEIKPDGTYSKWMHVDGKVLFYEGTWTRAGDMLHFVQTHEEFEEKPDSMDGKIEGDLIRLSHSKEGTSFPSVLRRSTQSAAPGK